MTLVDPSTGVSGGGRGRPSRGHGLGRHPGDELGRGTWRARRGDQDVRLHGLAHHVGGRNHVWPGVHWNEGPSSQDDGVRLHWKAGVGSGHHARRLWSNVGDRASRSKLLEVSRSLPACGGTLPVGVLAVDEDLLLAGAHLVFEALEEVAGAVLPGGARLGLLGCFRRLVLTGERLRREGAVLVGLHDDGDRREAQLGLRGRCGLGCVRRSVRPHLCVTTTKGGSGQCPIRGRTEPPV